MSNSEFIYAVGKIMRKSSISEISKCWAGLQIKLVDGKVLTQIYKTDQERDKIFCDLCVDLTGYSPRDNDTNEKLDNTSLLALSPWK